MRESPREVPLLFTIVMCGVLILLDRLAKIVAVHYLMPLGVVQAIPGLFEWRYIENAGAAFGFFSGMRWVLVVITGLALLVAAYILLFRRPKDKLEYLAIILIFSGGVGNWIDRMTQGFVVDYINVTFMNFAVFNLADIFVCVGFALLVFAVCRSEYRNSKKKKKLEQETKQEEGQETGPTANGTD